MEREKVKRNCNTCKFGLFARCDQLKNNEEYQAITRRTGSMMDAHEYKENFICDDYRCIYIEYPIEVSKINYDTNKGGYRDSEIGKLAKIRPCGEEYQNKTYLGIYLGDLPVSHHISHNPDTKELNVSFNNNPAIFVFELNQIIYGCESWWGIIKNETDLREITDIDIDNVWYVKALKTISS